MKYENRRAWSGHDPQRNSGQIRFSLGPETEVEFSVVHGSIVLKKAPKKLDLRKWKGRCKDSFAELGYTSVDRFIDDVRGR
jgi:hypothetical protein